MSTFKAFSITLFTLSITACGHEKEEIPVSDIPPNVFKVVQNALPGINIDEVERCTHESKVIYELEGETIDGDEYEIKISDKGKIIKIELDED